MNWYSCCRMLRKRIEYIFLILALTVMSQLYLEYKFYSMNQAEISRIHRLVQDYNNRGVGAKENNDSDGSISMVSPTYPLISVHYDRDRVGGEEEGEDNQQQLREQIKNMKEQRRNTTNNIKTDAVSENNKFRIQKMDSGDQSSYGIASTKYKHKSRNINQDTETIKYQPVCEIESKLARSAIDRAESVQCKQQIADIMCQHQQKYMFATNLPRYCPLKGTYRGGYIGCLRDDFANRLLNSIGVRFPNNNTLERCINFCLSAGLLYAGLEYSYECWCGNIERAIKLDDSECNMPCNGNSLQMCGGALALSVYHTGFGAMPGSDAPVLSHRKLQDEPIKIVFFLSVQSRALRQIQQLFRMIYDPGHYYNIHVDLNQEYVFREIKPWQNLFPNVIISHTRTSAGKYGPRSLDLQFNCFKEILSNKQWSWDYYINLHENQFPLRSVADLTDHLTRYQGMNFIGKHHEDVLRFTERNGLNQMYTECDDHTYLIGERVFPQGLYIIQLVDFSESTITSGSDSMCLHKNFVEYVVNSLDDLIQPLKEYYKYSALPTESFFHIALVNSVYCSTHVPLSLDLTVPGDDRKGCRCPDPEADICACQPLVHNTHTYTKLQMAENHTDHFYFTAQNFEGIVSQIVISGLENNILRNPNRGYVGIKSYWLNEYHYMDVHSQSDTHINAYYSMARNSLLTLNNQTHTTHGNTLKLQNVLEVNLFVYNDDIQGLAIQCSITSLHTQSPIIMEAFYSQTLLYKDYELFGLIKHFESCEVNTDWDPKEEIFRNYMGFLGPYSNISLAVYWDLVDSQADSDFSFNVIYIDPALDIAGSFELNVGEMESVTIHYPNFNGPLRPGVWNIQLLNSWQLFAQYSFVILPQAPLPLHLTSFAPYSPSHLKTIHSGPAGGRYNQQNISSFKIKDVNREHMRKAADINAMKIGEELVKWIDDLVQETYTLHEICYIIMPGSDKEMMLSYMKAAGVTSCEDTVWSSVSPDPKSDVTTLLKDKTRR